MPFKSRSQLKACFATNGFGGKVDCDKWAKETKNVKKLPDHVKKMKKKKKKYDLAGFVPGLVPNAADVSSYLSTDPVAMLAEQQRQQFLQKQQADRPLPGLGQATDPNIPAFQVPNYELKVKNQWGQPNYNHINLSNEIKGIAAFFRQNHANISDNAYYRAQMNPLTYEPVAANTSQQAQFGSSYFKKGGKAPKQKPLKPVLPQSLQRFNKKGQPVNIGQEEEIIDAYVSTISDPNQQQQVIDQLNKLKKNNPAEYYKTLSMIAQQIQQSQGQGQNLDPANTDPYQPQMTGQSMFKKGGMYKKPDGGPIDLDKELEEDIMGSTDAGPDTKQDTQPTEESQTEEQPDTSEGDALVMQSLMEPSAGSAMSNLTEYANSSVDYGENDVFGEPTGSIRGSAPTPDLSGHPTLQAFKNGIANVESGGDYYAKGKGSSAFGKYQIVKGTREMIRKEFFPSIKQADFESQYKTDPKFQERVMDVYGSHLVSKFQDPHVAATAFFVGEGNIDKVNQPDYNPGGNNMSIRGYLHKFDQGYNKKTYKKGGIYDIDVKTLTELKNQGYDFEIM